MTTAVQGPAAAPRAPMRRRLIIAGIVVVVLLLGWIVEFSSVFGVRSVSVSGTELLSSGQVRTAADIQSGTPLAKLDLGAIRDRVAAIPDVATVTVSKAYPSSVRIRITERVAVGYRAVGTGADLIDRNNVEFRTVKKPPAGLPQLELTADQDRSAAAATVAGALPAGFGKDVTLITAPSPESVALKLTDGRVVLWGGTDRDADKARLLPVLLKQPGDYFDLSDPSSVISRNTP